MRRTLIGALVIFVFSACTEPGRDPPPPPPDAGAKPPIDDDLDGFSPPEDCDDRDPQIHPGAIDIYYDNVDANCDEKNDFDADQDGSNHPADCADNDPLIFPGASDPPYDGEDTSCDAKNDFDADQDRYMPAGYETAFDTYCRALGHAGPEECYAAFYQGFPTNPADYFRDCADVPEQIPAATTLTPAQIYPGAADAHYDGVDSDCDRGNDFDADGDDYLALGTRAAYETYLASYRYIFAPSPLDGDCNDVDPGVRPGVLEILGDQVNQDCDPSGNDTSPFVDGGYIWTAPRNVVVGRTDQHYLLTTAADEMSAVPDQYPGLSLIFDRAAAFDARPSQIHIWHNNNMIGAAVDMIAEADRYYAALQYFDGEGHTLIASNPLNQDQTYQSYVQTQAFRPEESYVDIELQIDSDGNIWALGCGRESFAIVAGYDDLGVWSKRGGLCGDDSGALVCSDVDYAPVQTCFLDVPRATFCDGVICRSYDVGITTGAIVARPDQPATFTQVNSHNTWHIAERTDGVVLFDTTTMIDALAGHRVRAAELWEAANGMTYFAAAVEDENADGNGDVLLAYGFPGGMITEVVVPLAVGEAIWDARSAAIYADENRIFLAASGTGTGPAPAGDKVAWMFLGAR